MYMYMYMYVYMSHEKKQNGKKQNVHMYHENLLGEVLVDVSGLHCKVGGAVDALLLLGGLLGRLTHCEEV